MTQTKLILDVYRLWYIYDLGYEDLHMTFSHTDANEEPRLWLDCSDSFAWATADSEEIVTWNDLNMLRECVAKCLALTKHVHGFDVAVLYAARKRQLMPMPPRMKHIDKELHVLFEGLPPNNNWG